jgi:AcrR family transcriptional regulator
MASDPVNGQIVRYRVGVVADRETVPRPYHHGNLRQALIDAAVAAIDDGGPSSLSLRELARRVGVTHGAAAHHFGDKAGLVTAVATEGYRLMAEELEAVASQGGFYDVGVAYVRFATEHPAHFDVMYRPDLQRAGDQELRQARRRAAAVLYGAAEAVTDAAGGDVERAGVASWAFVHGIAVLWRDGNLPRRLSDPVSLAEHVLPYLFQASALAGRRSPRPR